MTADFAAELEQATKCEVSSGDAVKVFGRSILKEEATAKRALDPLQWFGILVPQPLRQAQADFQSAVADTTVRVLNIRNEMEELERLIHKRREEIQERDGKPG